MGVTFRHATSSMVTVTLLLCVASAAIAPSTGQAQILKKLEQRAKEAKAALEGVDALLQHAVRCMADDTKCIATAKAQKKPVVLTDSSGSVLTNAKGEPVTDPAQLPASSASAGSPSAANVRPTAASGPVPKLVLALPDSSWTSDTAVRHYRHHFLIGMDLWSAETNQLVQKGFAKGWDLWLVAGRPDLLVYEGHGNPAWGFAHSFPWVQRPGQQQVNRDGAKFVGATMELCLPGRACGDRHVRAPGAHQGPFLSDDFRRVVYFHDGDVWRADVDWATYEIVNRKQVTRVGILGDPQLDRWPTALHWHGNILFLKADLSKERPILRIDLASGEVGELPTMGIFERGSFANPGGNRICRRQEKVLACLDVRTGRTAGVPLPDVSAGRDEVYGQGRWSVDQIIREMDVPEGAYWADEETLVAHYSGAPKVSNASVNRPAVPAGVVRFDFRAGRADVIHQGGFADGNEERVESIARMELLPGSRHVAVDFTQAPAHHRKVRIGVEDGAVTTLPGVPMEGVWLDDDRFLYAKAEGGIGAIGTWVHDVRTGEATRVCHVPASLSPASRIGELRGVLAFPELDAVYFVSTTRGYQLFRAELSTGQCRKLTDGATGHDVHLARLGIPPIDLHLSEVGETLWRRGGAPK